MLAAANQTQTDCKQAGFTLIEVMVVIVIIAIVTALAVLSLDTSGSRQARINLQKFDAVLLFSKQQAISQGRTLQMRFTPYGYKMYIYKVDNNGFLLNQPVRGHWESYAGGLYDNLHIFRVKFTVTSLIHKKHHLTAVFILPNGYVTPFKLKLAQTGKLIHQLTFNAQGTKL